MKGLFCGTEDNGRNFIYPPAYDGFKDGGLPRSNWKSHCIFDAPRELRILHLSLSKNSVFGPLGSISCYLIPSNGGKMESGDPTKSFGTSLLIIGNSTWCLFCSNVYFAVVFAGN